MFEFIYSALALIGLFFLVAFVLVKLYEHGVRSWFVQTVLVFFGICHFLSRPREYVYSNTELWIFGVIALACIVVIDGNSSSIKHTKSNNLKEEVSEHQSSSVFQSFLNFLFLYSFLSYFYDDDDW